MLQKNIFIVGINKLTLHYEHFSLEDWNFLKLYQKYWKQKEFISENKAFQYCINTYD